MNMKSPDTGGCDGDGTVHPFIPPPVEQNGTLLTLPERGSKQEMVATQGPLLICFLYWVCDMTVTSTGALLIMDWNSVVSDVTAIAGVSHHSTGFRMDFLFRLFLLQLWECAFIDNTKTP